MAKMPAREGHQSSSQVVNQERPFDTGGKRILTSRSVAPK